MPGAKNKAKDPQQEKLKASKKQWNAAYRNFSQRLKAYKDSINGKGAAKFSLPTSDIKNPFPSQIGSFLGQLTGEFSALVSGAEKIISEQEQYSATRRKKQPKQVKPLGAPQPAPQEPPTTSPVVDTLSRLGSTTGQWGFEKHALLGELALGIGSAYAIKMLMSLFSRDEQTQFRFGMRRNAIELNNALLDLENSILSLSASSIPDSIKKYHSAQYDLDALLQTLNYLNETLKAAAEKNSAGKPAEAPSPSSQYGEKVKDIVAAMHVLTNTHGVSTTEMFQLHKMLEAYKNEEDPNTKDLLLDGIKDTYEAIVNSSMEAIQAAYGDVDASDPVELANVYEARQYGHNNEEEEAQSAPVPVAQPASVVAPQVKPTKAVPSAAPSQSEMDDLLFEKEPTNADNKSEELVKTAHNIMTRFLKRQLMKAAPFNKTVPHRLKIVELIGKCKEELKKAIHSLKKELDTETLSKNLFNVNKTLQEIGKVLAILGISHKRDLYNSPGKKNKSTNTWDDPLADAAVKQKIRRDLLKGML